MSATESAQPPASNATHAAATVPPSPSVGRRSRISSGRLLALAAAVALVAVAFVPVMSWIEYRRNHSITDDVFVEAHIVNVAPQLVSGRLIRYHVDENDQVVQGQVVAEIDPIPYRDKVNIARAQLESAEAELARQRADVDRVRKEVPIQIEIARRTFAAAASRPGQGRRIAEANPRRRREGDRRGPGRAEGGAGLSETRRTRIRTLYPTRTARGQHAPAPAADDAVPRLGPRPGRPEPGPAGEGGRLFDPDRRRTSHTGVSPEVGAESVNRASTSPRSATTRSASSSCWSRSRSEESNRRGAALEAAESDLEYTKIRAPFPGIVVKRYRHLGDYSPAGSPLLSMYNPDLLYMEANLEEDRLPGVEPGNPVHIKLDAFPAAVSRAGGLGQQIDRRTVRAHAEERRLGRVHSRRSARAGTDSDRARRPLAAPPRRTVGDRGQSLMAPATPPGRRMRPGR